MRLGESERDGRGREERRRRGRRAASGVRRGGEEGELSGLLLLLLLGCEAVVRVLVVPVGRLTRLEERVGARVESGDAVGAVAARCACAATVASAVGWVRDRLGCDARDCVSDGGRGLGVDPVAVIESDALARLSGRARGELDVVRSLLQRMRVGHRVMRERRLIDEMLLLELMLLLHHRRQERTRIHSFLRVGRFARAWPFFSPLLKGDERRS